MWGPSHEVPCWNFLWELKGWLCLWRLVPCTLVFIQLFGPFSNLLLLQVVDVETVDSWYSEQHCAEELVLYSRSSLYPKCTHTMRVHVTLPDWHITHDSTIIIALSSHAQAVVGGRIAVTRWPQDQGDALNRMVRYNRNLLPTKGQFCMGLKSDMDTGSLKFITKCATGRRLRRSIVSANSKEREFVRS